MNNIINTQVDDIQCQYLRSRRFPEKTFFHRLPQIKQQRTARTLVTYDPRCFFGRKTVRHVANIYKYYAAYKRLPQQHPDKSIL